MWLWLESTSLIASVCSLFSDQMQESGTVESQQEIQIARRRKKKVVYSLPRAVYRGEVGHYRISQSAVREKRFLRRVLPLWRRSVKQEQ